MIIVKLYGGLGNQMFQYALGRALSLRTGADVRFDRSWYAAIPDRETARAFELDAFSLPIRFADTADIPIEQRPVRERYETLRNALLRRFPLWRCVFGAAPWTLVFDRSRGFQKEVLGFHAHQNVYLQGYWQSEKYFQDEAGVIRRELSFSEPPDGKNQALLDKMAADTSRGYATVSLHVRRGDYSANPEIKAVHGLLPVTYYDAAMGMMAARLEKISYYVFSDDLTWCRANLKFDGEVTFVDVNAGKPGWTDMRLMAACRHHILANSSFSWWGAWLDGNKDKIVVAPEPWSRSGHDDVLPDSWLRGKC